MDLYRKKFAVLDLTHGGIPIAKGLAAAGNEVSGIDVYGTVKPEMLLELEEKYGIHCSKTPLPASGFDLIVAPVHLDPAYPMLVEARTQKKNILSHHAYLCRVWRAYVPYRKNKHRRPRKRHLSRCLNAGIYIFNG